VVADLTPAYTNRWSGLGRFADRTRRVERYTRTFVHDRALDVVLVRDSLTLTEAGFTTRWLLHTEEEPVTTAEGFRADVAAREGAGRGGGSLHAVVLGPEPVAQAFIGGPGREFEVDGRNYDDGGEVLRFLATRPAAEREAGAWRVELTASAGPRAEFLVALLPRDPAAAPLPAVRRLADADQYGAEWEGAGRTLRWWFRPGEDLPRVELRRHGGDWQPVTLALEPAPATGPRPATPAPAETSLPPRPAGLPTPLEPPAGADPGADLPTEYPATPPGPAP
jgi:hypothetical protein